MKEGELSPPPTKEGEALTTFDVLSYINPENEDAPFLGMLNYFRAMTPSQRVAFNLPGDLNAFKAFSVQVQEAIAAQKEAMMKSRNTAEQPEALPPARETETNAAEQLLSGAEGFSLKLYSPDILYFRNPINGEISEFQAISDYGPSNGYTWISGIDATPKITLPDQYRDLSKAYHESRQVRRDLLRQYRDNHSSPPQKLLNYFLNQPMKKAQDLMF